MKKGKFLLFVVASSMMLSAHVNAKGSKGSHSSKHTVYQGTFSGAQEVTGNTPEGVDGDLRGTIYVFVNRAKSKVSVLVRANDASNIVAAHLHCGIAGTNGPVALGFISPGPLSVSGNRIRGSLDNSNIQGAGCDAAIGRPINNIASLAAAMDAGLIYLNLHTPAFPGGEARAQMSRRGH